MIRGEDPDTTFTRALDVELEKVSSFFGVKERELLDEVNQLLRDATEEEGQGLDNSSHARPPTRGSERARQAGGRRGSLQSNHSTEDGADDSDEEDDETTGLTQKRRLSWARRKTLPNLIGASTDMTASTDLTRSRRYSTMFDYPEQAIVFSSAIMLKRRIVSLYVQLCELKSYVQLNKTGFRKVLKKYDKILERSLRQKYMAEVVEPAYPFSPAAMQTIEEKIAEVEKLYAEKVTHGDAEVARKDLRSHLREHVVWERNTVWRDMIGLERRAEAASLGRTLLGRDGGDPARARLQGDDEPITATKEILTPLGKITCPVWLLSPAVFNLMTILVVFCVLLLLPILESPEQQNCLAMLVFVSLLWATEVATTTLFLDTGNPAGDVNSPFELADRFLRPSLSSSRR